MPFTIDEDSLLIRGRKGDTASFTFEFDYDLSDYTVYFYVKKNLNSLDEIIEKEYSNISGASVDVDLTVEDTEKLTSVANSYSIYYWGVKITKGSEYAETIIPQEFKNPPMMYIYPEIGGL
jgi:hypothetical protein